MKISAYMLLNDASPRGVAAIPYSIRDHAQLIWKFLVCQQGDDLIIIGSDVKTVHDHEHLFLLFRYETDEGSSITKDDRLVGAGTFLNGALDSWSSQGLKVTTPDSLKQTILETLT
jgi:fructose 1,6-bisphosphatase